jgi:hypothetical protein
MEATIQAGHGEVTVSTDAAGLRLQVAGRNLAWQWTDLTGGGFARHPGAGRVTPDLPDEIAGVLPGFRTLRSVGVELAESHQALVLAASGGSMRSFLVLLPMQDPGTAALQAELAAQLQQRWLGADHQLEELRSRLGIGYPRWFAWGATAVALLIGLVTILPALAGFAAIKDAIEDRDLAVIGSIHPISWLAIVIWLVFVGWALRRLGRLGGQQR